MRNGVDVEHSANFLLRLLEDRLGHVDPGVVDEDCGRAMGGADLFGHGVEVRGGGHVAGVVEDVGCCCSVLSVQTEARRHHVVKKRHVILLERLTQRLSRLMDIEGDDGGGGLDEPSHDGGSDATGAAGHEDYLLAGLPGVGGPVVEGAAGEVGADFAEDAEG